MEYLSEYIAGRLRSANYCSNTFFPKCGRLCRRFVKDVRIEMEASAMDISRCLEVVQRLGKVNLRQRQTPVLVSMDERTSTDNDEPDPIITIGSTQIRGLLRPQEFFISLQAKTEPVSWRLVVY